MNKISDQEIKAIELHVLKTLTNYCDKNGIRYFLSYGTLIGAIRHQGFIPWDDDIDVVIPRPDYMRLIKLLGNQEISFCKLSSPYNNRDHFLPYSKIYHIETEKIEEGVQYRGTPLGIDVDIFPLDGVPEDERKAEKFYKVQKKLFRWSVLSFSPYEKSPNMIRTALRYIRMFLVKLVGNYHWIILLNKRALKYPYEGSKMVGVPVIGYDNVLKRINRSCFDESIPVHFEGEVYLAPKGYDEFLRTLYGDYMQLPPEDKRISTHLYEAYWR
ncbi:MAG: phosphorylcholine transferase LicD [Acutalibacteraceae bacterium]